MIDLSLTTYFTLTGIRNSNSTEFSNYTKFLNITDATKAGLKSAIKGFGKVTFLTPTVGPFKNWLSSNAPYLKDFAVSGLSFLDGEFSYLVDLCATIWNGDSYSDSKFFSIPKQVGKLTKLTCSAVCKISIKNSLRDTTNFLASTGTKMVCTPICSRIKDATKDGVKELLKGFDALVNVEQSNFLNGLNGTYIQNPTKATALLPACQVIDNSKTEQISSIYNIAYDIRHKIEEFIKGEQISISTIYGIGRDTLYKIGKFTHDYMRDSFTIFSREVLLLDDFFGKDSLVPHTYYVLTSAYHSYLDAQDATINKDQTSATIQEKEPLDESNELPILEFDLIEVIDVDTIESEELDERICLKKSDDVCYNNNDMFLVGDAIKYFSY